MLFIFKRVFSLRSNTNIILITGKNQVECWCFKKFHKGLIFVIVFTTIAFIKCQNRVSYHRSRPCDGMAIRYIFINLLLTFIIHHSPMMGIKNGIFYRFWQSFYLKFFNFLGGCFPSTVVPIFFLGFVFEFNLIHIKNIRPDICNTPSHVFVETNSDTWPAWYTNAIDIDRRRTQLHLIPDGRQRQAQVRVIGQNRKSCG